MNRRTVILLLPGLAAAAFAAKTPKPKNDDEATDLLRRKLANDPVVKGGALDVDVKGGVATLRGTVETEKIKDRAGKMASKSPGVKSVRNELAIGPRPKR